MHSTPGSCCGTGQGKSHRSDILRGYVHPVNTVNRICDGRDPCSIDIRCLATYPILESHAPVHRKRRYESIEQKRPSGLGVPRGEINAISRGWTVVLALLHRFQVEEDVETGAMPESFVDVLVVVVPPRLFLPVGRGHRQQ